MSPDQYWSILINIDQDFSLRKSQTLFQNNYLPSPDLWKVLINIDQYWSILIRTLVVLKNSLWLWKKSPDQYWSILINIDQYRSGLSCCFETESFERKVLSILINIDQYWSGLFFTKVTDSVQNNHYAESWSILINIDQYWSILMRTFLYKSQRLCFKTIIMPSPDQYWSILINIDQYWSILIRNFLPKSQTLFQNNYYAESWSILINIDQYWSGLFFTKVTDSVSKQLLCRVLIYIDLYRSILFWNRVCDWKYRSILINIDQYWLGLFITKVTDSVSKQL